MNCQSTFQLRIGLKKISSQISKTGTLSTDSLWSFKKLCIREKKKLRFSSYVTRAHCCFMPVGVFVRGPSQARGTGQCRQNCFYFYLNALPNWGQNYLGWTEWAKLLSFAKKSPLLFKSLKVCHSMSEMRKIILNSFSHHASQPTFSKRKEGPSKPPLHSKRQAPEGSVRTASQRF